MYLLHSVLTATKVVLHDVILQVRNRLTRVRHRTCLVSCDGEAIDEGGFEP